VLLYNWQVIISSTHIYMLRQWDFFFLPLKPKNVPVIYQTSDRQYMKLPINIEIQLSCNNNKGKKNN
jgi:hypothetical protein